MTRSSLWLALPSLFALSTPARADEVVLHDGRTLYGATEDRGASVVISTRDGEVTVARSDIVRRRSSEDLRVDLLGLASRCGKLSAFSCLHLALTARDWDLGPEMWSYLDRALADQDMPGDVRTRLDEFMGTLEPEVLSRRWRKSTAAIKAREILAALPAKASPGRQAATALVLAGLSGVDHELRVRARGQAGPHQRAAANEALWLRNDTDTNRNFVLRTAVFDSAEQVRSKVLALATRSGAGRTAADYLAAWLVHPDQPEWRIRAAEALTALGEPSAVDALVKAGPFAAAGGEFGVRAHAAFITQQSYIRDFDVEVAQSSFIADPKVDVISSGTVLDVRVGAVVTYRVVHTFRRAIAKLEGADPGDSPAKWEAWLAERRAGQAR